jgi:hypothetical protein
VRPGDDLFTVSDFSTLRTTVWVTDRQVGAITPGMPARARWQDVEIAGEVVQVDLAMDETMKAFCHEAHLSQRRPCPPQWCHGDGGD